MRTRDRHGIALAGSPAHHALAKASGALRVRRIGAKRVRLDRNDTVRRNATSSNGAYGALTR